MVTSQTPNKQLWQDSFGARFCTVELGHEQNENIIAHLGLELDHVQVILVQEVYFYSA
jgi:hypothetical protein